MTTEAGARKRILIVDNDPAVADSLTKLFNENGFDSRVVSDSEEAFNIFSTEIFDMVVTELKLSGEFPVIEFIKFVKTGFETPAVVISDYSDIALISESVHHGAEDFLPKPLDEKYLLSLVKETLERDENQDEKETLGSRSFTIRFDLESNADALPPLRNFIMKNADSFGLDNQRASSLWLCAKEMIENAIVHGNKGDENKRVTATIRNTPREVAMSVADEGEGYGAAAAGAKDKSEDLLKQGLGLIDALADDVKFNDKRNEITATLLK